MEKLPTIKLKGAKYVMVKDRILCFNEIYPNGSIQTKIVQENTNMVTFMAVVTPDVDKPTRFFTGHAFGTIDEVKAFEKLETVALGRALAFMGIGVLESVASAEEMQNFNTKNPATKLESGLVVGGILANDESGYLKKGTKNNKDWYGLFNINGQIIKWLSGYEYDLLMPKDLKNII